MNENMAAGILSHWEIRARARQALKGYWVRMTLLTLVFLLVSACLSLEAFDWHIARPEVVDRTSLAVDYQGVKTWTADAESGSEDDIAGLIVRLPGRFWAFYAAIAAVSTILPMMGCGLVLANRQIMCGRKPGPGMLFQGRVFIRTLIAGVICAAPAAAVSVLGFAGQSTAALTAMIILQGCALVLSYGWSMRFYLLTEKPELGFADMLRESRRRMRGHKWRLFVFHLTFFGWRLGLTVLLRLISAPGIFPIAVLAVQYIAGAALTAYENMGQTIFHHNLYMCQQAGTDNVTASGEPEPELIPDTGSIRARAGDEALALSMLSAHGFSFVRMAETGTLEDYRALGVSQMTVAGWMSDYSKQLTDSWPEDPGALEAAIDFAEEYGDDFTLDRLTRRMNDAIDRQALSPEAMLDHCLRMTGALNGGAFDDKPAFVRRQKEALSDMADRLEHRLNETDPNGTWRKSAALLRVGCAE